MSHSRAMVLTYLPTTGRCALLDETQGRLHALVTTVPRQPRLMQGAMISYTGKEQKDSLRITSVQITQLPLPALCTDLRFLHKVITIILHTLPRGIESTELFALITMLYDNEHEKLFFDEQIQQLFLCKLLLLLGIYPEEQVFRQAPQLSQILLLPVDECAATTLQSLSPHLLTKWLASCWSEQNNRNNRNYIV